MKTADDAENAEVVNFKPLKAAVGKKLKPKALDSGDSFTALGRHCGTRETARFPQSGEGITAVQSLRRPVAGL